MIPPRVFHMAWLIFIYLYLMLGISLALIAGTELALRDFAVGLIAAVLATVCGVLCALARETRRELPRSS